MTPDDTTLLNLKPLRVECGECVLFRLLIGVLKGPCVGSSIGVRFDPWGTKCPQDSGYDRTGDGPLSR